MNRPGAVHFPLSVRPHLCTLGPDRPALPERGPSPFRSVAPILPTVSPITRQGAPPTTGDPAIQVPVCAPWTRRHSCCAFVSPVYLGRTANSQGVPLATRAATPRPPGAGTPGFLRCAPPTRPGWARRPVRPGATGGPRSRSAPRWRPTTAGSAPGRLSPPGQWLVPRPDVRRPPGAGGRSRTRSSRRARKPPGGPRSS